MRVEVPFDGLGQRDLIDPVGANKRIPCIDYISAELKDLEFGAIGQENFNLEWLVGL
jgi:hypothetical protein